MQILNISCEIVMLHKNTNDIGIWISFVELKYYFIQINFFKNVIDIHLAWTHLKII